MPSLSSFYSSSDDGPYTHGQAMKLNRNRIQSYLTGGWVVARVILNVVVKIKYPLHLARIESRSSIPS
jgi:hypothetical protein